MSAEMVLYRNRRDAVRSRMRAIPREGNRIFAVGAGSGDATRGARTFRQAGLGRITARGGNSLGLSDP